MRHLPCIILAAALAAHAADGKPDFTVSAEELAREYRDGKGAARKYAGKVVEVTGAFHSRRPGDVLLSGHRGKGVEGDLVSCTPTKEAGEKHQRLYGLARGQKVTFRGVVSDNERFPVLEGCELVGVGPSPAAPVTLSKLRAMFLKPAEARRNDGKAVIARVRIVKIDASGKSRVVYTVAGVGGKSKLTTQVFVDTFYDPGRTAELHKVKAGEVWYALGVADDQTGTPRFWAATLLKEPPEGVKMPAGKK
jgi:hypothetical protein